MKLVGLKKKLRGTERTTTNIANFEGCWAKKSPEEQKELEQTRPTLKIALALSDAG